MVWWNLYTFNIKKRRLKKTFPHKKLCSFERSVNIFQATREELGPACQSRREFSYSSTVKITIQIQHFAENYGKQTLKGILLSNEEMSCRHTKSPFCSLRSINRFCGKGESGLCPLLQHFQFYYTIRKLKYSNTPTSLSFPSRWSIKKWTSGVGAGMRVHSSHPPSRSLSVNFKYRVWSISYNFSLFQNKRAK